MCFTQENRLALLLVFVVASITNGLASPREDRVLRLVPGGTEIVAGIEDPQNENSGGRLLFITHNNKLDLTDCLALTGVDTHRQVSQLVEVAASSERGELQEHLLLGSGHFDRELIFRTAIQGGATASSYQAITAVAVEPFARELKEMKDRRWVALPDKETLLFGSPELVRRALDRYISGAPVDADLGKRLRQLRPDMNRVCLKDMRVADEKCRQ